MAQYDYRFALGWNVALGSLSNIETTLGQYNRDANSILYPIGIRSQPVDFYPVVTQLESGRVRGDGKVAHEWQLSMFVPAVTYLVGLWSAKSAKWTIYTRLHELGTYARYNCWAVRPSGTDLVYQRQQYMTLTLRFTDLLASS